MCTIASMSRRRKSIDPNGPHGYKAKLRAHARGEPVTLTVLELIEAVLDSQPLALEEQKHLRLMGYGGALSARWLDDTCGYAPGHFEQRFHLFRSGLSINGLEKIAYLTDRDLDFWRQREFSPDEVASVRFNLTKRDADLVAVPSNILAARLAERHENAERVRRASEPELPFVEQRYADGTLIDPASESSSRRTPMTNQTRPSAATEQETRDGDAILAKYERMNTPETIQRLMETGRKRGLVPKSPTPKEPEPGKQRPSDRILAAAEIINEWAANPERHHTLVTLVSTASKPISNVEDARTAALARAAHQDAFVIRVLQLDEVMEKFAPFHASGLLSSPRESRPSVSHVERLEDRSNKNDSPERA